MIIWAIVITWVILAILFIVSDEFIGSSTFMLNHKLAKMFNPEKVKLHRNGKDFKSLPHKQELINSVDELRQMGYTDKFIDEMKN